MNHWKLSESQARNLGADCSRNHVHHRTSDSMDDMSYITIENALKLLPTGAKLRVAENTAPSTLLMYELPREQVVDAVENGRPETTGPHMTSLGYKMMCWVGKKRLFVYTEQLK
jgi:hypothetical protein